MKLIFLDIDGVLNTNGNWGRDEFAANFCPEAINALRHIISETGAVIIISSSWKASGLGWFTKLWRFRKYPGTVLGITPYVKVNDSLSFKQRAERGHEIKQFLDDYFSIGELDSYVIIDDDDDMLPEQESFFVQTDGQIGLTNDDAVKAIYILNENN